MKKLAGMLVATVVLVSSLAGCCGMGCSPCGNPCPTPCAAPCPCPAPCAAPCNPCYKGG